MTTDVAPTNVYAPPATTGEILNVGFGVLFGRFIPLVFASILVHLPLFLFYLLADPADIAGFAGNVYLILIVDILLSLVLAGAVAALVVGRLRGTDPGLMSALGTGLKRLPSILGLTIVLAIIIGVPTVALVFVGSLLGMAGLIIFGIAALVIAFLLMARFWVALPAVVLGEPGPLMALETSSALTTGRRASVIGALVVVAIVTGGISWITEQIALGMPDLMSALYVQLGVGIVVALIGSVLPAAGYYLLTAEQESRWQEEQKRAQRRAAEKAAPRPIHQGR